MNRVIKGLSVVLFLTASVGSVGCDKKTEPSPNAAPKSSSLAPAKPPSPKSSKFAVKADSSKVTFLMDAPVEKIFGHAPKSTAGDLFVDLTDITKSTGLLKIDLDKLVIYQQKVDPKTKKFGERVKKDKQNEHARNWMEIGPDSNAKTKAKNRFIEYKITKITAAKKNVNKLSGDERKLDMTVSGDFRLHERTVKKDAELELTFRYKDGKPVSVHVKSKKPIKVGLEEHDIKPRDAVGKLLRKSLAALSDEVAKEAQVSIEFDAPVKAK